MGAAILVALALWPGALVGLAVSLLAVGALALARGAARRADGRSWLAAMPAWQDVLPAVLGLPAGLGLSLAAVVFGPGF